MKPTTRLFENLIFSSTAALPGAEERISHHGG